MSTKPIALSLAILALLSGVYLIIDRSGVIAWLAFILGVGMLTKTILKPSPSDGLYSAIAATVPAILWAATFYYVINTWESGEVVELAIDTNAGSKIARVWVMDIDGAPTIYYDAEPAAASAILSGKPLQMTRAGATHTYVPEAVSEADISQEHSDLIYAAMAEKYGERVKAADLYYVMLGRPSDRVGVVAKLILER